MRTASAWLYKQQSETLGKTFKVQDTNIRAMTGIQYRGSIPCGPAPYNQITQKKFVCGSQCTPGQNGQTLK